MSTPITFRYLFHLLYNYLPHLFIRNRSETIVVHSHVILRGIQILESSCIYPRIALPGMDMAKQLPHVLVAAFEAEEGIVAKVDFPLANLYAHLHGHVFEPSEESLSDVLQVVVAEDEIYPAVQPVKKPCPLSRTSQTEVAEMEDCVILADHFVPIGDYSFVHLFDIPERAVAKPDNVRMVEMRVGREKRMFCIKLEIHFLFMLL